MHYGIITKAFSLYSDLHHAFADHGFMHELHDKFQILMVFFALGVAVKVCFAIANSILEFAWSGWEKIKFADLGSADHFDFLIFALLSPIIIAFAIYIGIAYAIILIAFMVISHREERDGYSASDGHEPRSSVNALPAVLAIATIGIVGGFWLYRDYSAKAERLAQEQAAIAAFATSKKAIEDRIAEWRFPLPERVIDGVVDDFSKAPEPEANFTVAPPGSETHGCASYLEGTVDRSYGFHGLTVRTLSMTEPAPNIAKLDQWLKAGRYWQAGRKDVAFSPDGKSAILWDLEPINDQKVQKYDGLMDKGTDLFLCFYTFEHPVTVPDFPHQASAS